jgi:hypothetical protein
MGKQKRFSSGTNRKADAALLFHVATTPKPALHLTIEKMNRRRMLVVLGLLILVVGTVFFIWPRESGEPKFHLKIVRQTQEQGIPVAFFQLLGPSRRIQVTDIRRAIKRRSNT